MQKFEEREAITLANHGQKIFGILHRPLHQHKVPAILICPGFAGNKTGKQRLFVQLAETLVKMGIAVFRFDYRGSGDSEGDFHELTLEGKVEDALICLDFLTRDSQIDATRIGLLGRSLGGVIAIKAASRCPSSIKSLVLWSPVFFSTPWQKLWKAYQSQQVENLNQVLTSIPLPEQIPNQVFLEQFFKLNLQDDLKLLEHIPLLHIQGELDQIVNIEQAHAYQQARKEISQTRFILLPKSTHDFTDFSEQKIAIMETCKWYQQTL